MSTDGSDWQGEGGDELEEPISDRPYGARPYGARPYGARPYGARPYGARPYGLGRMGSAVRGSAVWGSAVWGQAVRSEALRRERVEGSCRPAAWGDEICELALSRSAVVRLGATVVSSDTEVTIPTHRDGRVSAARRQAANEAPPGQGRGQLNPAEWRLEAWISVPNRVLRSLRRTLSCRSHSSSIWPTDSLAPQTRPSWQARIRGELPQPRSRWLKATTRPLTARDVVTNLRGNRRHRSFAIQVGYSTRGHWMI